MAFFCAWPPMADRIILAFLFIVIISADLQNSEFFPLLWHLNYTICVIGYPHLHVTHALTILSAVQMRRFFGFCFSSFSTGAASSTSNSMWCSCWIICIPFLALFPFLEVFTMIFLSFFPVGWTNFHNYWVWQLFMPLGHAIQLLRHWSLKHRSRYIFKTLESPMNSLHQYTCILCSKPINFSIFLFL